jgi:hypothetical protein
MPHKITPPFYWVWSNMKDRCRNPNNIQWKDYGGRGIRVCERWKSYKNFADDMGPRPTGTLIDRIDNDGDYEPGNCRWSTRKEQQRNQRRSIWLTIEGAEYLAIALAEQSGLKCDTIVARAKAGLSLAEVISPERRISTAGFIKGPAAAAAKRHARTHCTRGHEYTVENTYLSPQGWRYCRICHNAKMRRRTAAKRTA